MKGDGKYQRDEWQTRHEKIQKELQKAPDGLTKLDLAKNAKISRPRLDKHLEQLDKDEKIICPGPRKRLYWAETYRHKLEVGFDALEAWEQSLEALETTRNKWENNWIEGSISIQEMVASQMEAHLEDYKSFGMYEEAKATINRARKNAQKLRELQEQRSKEARADKPATPGPARSDDRLERALGHLAPKDGV